MLTHKPALWLPLSGPGRVAGNTGLCASFTLHTLESGAGPTFDAGESFSAFGFGGLLAGG